MAKRMKSLTAQIHSMTRLWPQFTLVSLRENESAIWLGELKGLDRPFSISIEYDLPVPDQYEPFRDMPLVRVLEPSLVVNWDAQDEAPLPHVYFEKPDIRLSPLCLFDPAAGEWDPSMFISRTTVWWAARWLAAYEFWEMTGRWIGGGRHPENPSKKVIEHAS